jgi:hypothetical protein
VIDNIQIDIRNVYVRLEDSISNINEPWALGLTIQQIQIYTANDDWERDYVAGETISKKTISLQNLSIFINFEDNLSYDSMVEGEVDLKSIHHDILDEIKRDKSVSEDIIKYKSYVWQECLFMRKNNYILPSFSLEVHF